ncbi:MAG: hypothetical protein MK198_05920 [Gracilimonas sp.]|uniref:DUF1059 domain-containing protein n=1 Tax=Gracilimonas sp. TaxID=1974203 RepID=UPI00375350EE|nr:hypothetical protein [Gracilimonas sp.]
MKTMTCRQLGGACDKKFKGKTFQEIAEQSKKHGTEMFKQEDEAHLQAMQEMSEMMNDPEARKQWMEKKRKEFKSLPEEN